MEWVVGGVLVWSIALVVVVSAQARERERAFIKQYGMMWERSMRTATQMLEKVLNPTMRDEDLNPTATGDEGTQSTNGQTNPQEAMRRVFAQMEDTGEVRDPIDLSQPLDAFGQDMGGDDDGLYGLDVMTNASEARERAVIVPPGFDPIADIERMREEGLADEAVM